MSGGLAATLGKPIVIRLAAWVGVFGFMIGTQPRYYGSNCLTDVYIPGITAVLVVRMWFEKAVEDFNKSIISQGKNGPELVASTANGFTSA